MFSFDPAVPENKINEGQVWPNLTDYAMNNSVVALPDNMEMRGSQRQHLSEKRAWWVLMHDFLTCIIRMCWSTHKNI